MVGPRAYCTVHMMVCNREKAMLLFSRTLKQILGRPYTIIIDYPVQSTVPGSSRGKHIDFRSNCSLKGLVLWLLVGPSINISRPTYDTRYWYRWYQVLPGTNPVLVHSL